MKDQILSMLPVECPWRDTLHWYSTLDSTNTTAKQLAKAGAPHGTVLIADLQTGGRGRSGRSFSSPAGGMYLSVILRPECNAEALMHLTCAVAVAGCNAVAQAAGFRPQIKWTNDLVWDKKKLGGILTELSVDSKTGLVEYAIIGIGINCLIADFPDIATSLQQICGKEISPAAMAGAMITALWQMDLNDRSALLAQYEKDCMTIGQDIVLVRGEDKQYGTAIGLAADGGLVVRFQDGAVQTVQSGEVSVRGMYGYI